MMGTRNHCRDSRYSLFGRCGIVPKIGPKSGARERGLLSRLRLGEQQYNSIEAHEERLNDDGGHLSERPVTHGKGTYDTNTTHHISDNGNTLLIRVEEGCGKQSSIKEDGLRLSSTPRYSSVFLFEEPVRRVSNQLPSLFVFEE